MNVIKLKLSGLHCTSCCLNIDSELEDLAGVISSDTSYARSTTQIKFNSQEINLKKIKKQITQLGYQVL